MNIYGKWIFKRCSVHSILIFLGLMLFLAMSASCVIGRYYISPRQTIGILLSKLIFIEPYWTSTMESVLLNIRLPRILLACMVGCSLSVAGSTYQGVFRNQMASPDILGASSGATFGAALAILGGASSSVVILSAFICGMFSIAIVIALGSVSQGKISVNLVLIGIMVSSLFSAGTSFIKLVADPQSQLPSITYWIMGSFSGSRWADVRFSALPMTAVVVPFLMRWRINILSLGEDEANTLGINVRLLRTILVLSATIITAASVAVSGMIAWVGLVIPHICRRLVGNDYRCLMPASMLGGALFMLVVDGISRNLLATEIPIGIITAFIGVPFLLYVLARGL